MALGALGTLAFGALVGWTPEPTPGSVRALATTSMWAQPQYAEVPEDAFQVVSIQRDWFRELTPRTSRFDVRVRVATEDGGANYCIGVESVLGQATLAYSPRRC